MQATKCPLNLVEDCKEKIVLSRKGREEEWVESLVLRGGGEGLQKEKSWEGWKRKVTKKWTENLLYISSCCWKGKFLDPLSPLCVTSSHFKAEKVGVGGGWRVRKWINAMQRLARNKIQFIPCTDCFSKLIQKFI